eukprot:2076967-Pyramimonas_sp.AAC.1
MARLAGRLPLYAPRAAASLERCGGLSAPAQPAPLLLARRRGRGMIGKGPIAICTRTREITPSSLEGEEEVQ